MLSPIVTWTLMLCLLGLVALLAVSWVELDVPRLQREIRERMDTEDQDIYDWERELAE